MTGSFRLWQTARFTVIIAMQMQSVAVGWQIYETTSKYLSLGLVGLAQFLPMLLLSLVTGQVADRFDRKRVVALCYALFVVTSLGLYRVREPAGVYALLVLVGVGRAFAGPAGQALLPSLVPEGRLAKAIAQNSALLQAGMVVGPALGGFLYKLAGPSVVYPACAGLFAAAVASCALLRPRAVAIERRAVSVETLLSGVRYVRQNKIVLGAISLDMLGVLFGGAVALLPVFAKDYLAIGPIGLGLLRSAPAIGAGLTGVVLSLSPIRARAGTKLLLAMGAFGVATIVFGLSRSFPLSLVALFLVGASDMVNVVIRMTLVQLATPEEMRGRVSAVNLVFIGASNELGELESGLMAQWMGPVASVVLGGCCTVAVALTWAWLFPSLRRVDRLEDAQRSD
jgi:hypothetical protein